MKEKENREAKNSQFDLLFVSRFGEFAFGHVRYLVA